MSLQYEETAPETDRAWAIETNGINAIPDADRHGRPQELFWIWCAANIGILGITYGTTLVAFYSLNLPQAIVAAVAGSVLSFLLVGFVALAGKRAGAPTMTLSRAPFGVRGNGLPTLVSYLSLVGWETILVSLSTLAAGTVLDRLELGHGNVTLAISFAVIVLITVAVGMLGHATIVNVQTWFTWAFAILSVGYLALVLPKIHFDRVGQLHAASFGQFIGGLSIIMAGLGIGWVNTGADYSRYLPRTTSSRSVVGWTTFGASIAPIILIAFGALLGADNPKLASAANPIGVLADPLPTWFLVPYLVTAVGGLIAGALMDIYSSGLNLLALGIRLPRYQSVLIDGAIMVAGTIYIIFFAQDFIGPFQGFLITLGVPITAWAAIFLVDMRMFRRTGYDEPELYRPTGRHGAVNYAGVVSLVVATVVGLGLVTSTASIFKWAGFLLGPLGGKTGTWGSSSIGLTVAFVLGGALYALLASTVWRPAVAVADRQLVPEAR